MAERRLQLVKKEPMKDTRLANAYQGVIDDYLKKEYIELYLPLNHNQRANGFYRIFQWYAQTEKKNTSNQAEVLKDIPAEDENKLSTTKTLGVLWTADEDNFSFKYSLTPGIQLTKRNVLKKTATIYDPLGFLAPYVVGAKLLIQQAWIEAADWDIPLPVHHQEQWKSWFQESKGLEGICIPRCLKERHSTAVKDSLHTFSDASEAAYAAAVHICQEYEDKSTRTRLLGPRHGFLH